MLELSNWSKISVITLLSSEYIIKVLIESFLGNTLKVISVRAVSVPKDPVTNFERSYPVTFLTTVPPDLIISHLPLTTLNPRI